MAGKPGMPGSFVAKGLAGSWRGMEVCLRVVLVVLLLQSTNAIQVERVEAI